MISSHLIYHFFRHLKTCRSLIIALITSGLFVLHATGDDVSFYVPEDHEKYGLLDSLYTQIEASKQVMEQLENRLIRDKAIREDDLTVKGQYFDYLLKQKKSTLDKILEFCYSVKNHYSLQENYFTELLSILEDDSRAKCFIFLRNARTELGKINIIIAKYDKKEEKNTLIIDRGGRNELSDDYDNINDPLSDILEPEEDENPFAGTENTMIKLEIDRSETEGMRDTTKVSPSK